MDSPLRHERSEDGVVTLWLGSPERNVVVLDQNLLNRLDSALDEIERDGEPSGFVLASESDRVFVAGADLAEIDGLSDEELETYLKRGIEVFGRVAALPCPTVAAINGAALGGGLEIAMHCDALIARRPGAEEKPYPVGLPEAGLGLCPGWGGTQMLPARIDPKTAIISTVSGRTWKVSDVPKGLFTTFVEDSATLPEAAREWVRDHAGIEKNATPRAIDRSNRDAIARALEAVRSELPDTAAARAVAEAIETGIESGWTAAVEVERRRLIELRHTPEARERLAAFFARSGAGSGSSSGSRAATGKASG